jgi:hypothetical protein
VEIDLLGSFDVKLIKLNFLAGMTHRL